MKTRKSLSFNPVVTNKVDTNIHVIGQLSLVEDGDTFQGVWNMGILNTNLSEVKLSEKLVPYFEAVRPSHFSDGKLSFFSDLPSYLKGSLLEFPRYVGAGFHAKGVTYVQLVSLLDLAVLKMARELEGASLAQMYNTNLLLAQKETMESLSGVTVSANYFGYLSMGEVPYIFFEQGNLRSVVQSNFLLKQDEGMLLANIRILEGYKDKLTGKKGVKTYGSLFFGGIDRYVSGYETIGDYTLRLPLVDLFGTTNYNTFAPRFYGEFLHKTFPKKVLKFISEKTNKGQSFLTQLEPDSVQNDFELGVLR